MSPYQRAAAVAVVPRPSAGPVTGGRRRWRGHRDRVAQGLLGFAVAVVLAAMAVNWLDGFLDLVGHTAGARDVAVRTWALDAITLLALSTVGVVHSATRRGRPGRWPLAVLGVSAAASVVLVPVFAG